MAKRTRRPSKPAASLAPEVQGAPGSASPSTRALVLWGALLVLAGGAVVWNHHHLFFLSWTDEQIHFYVARRLAEGAVLYRDIDSARPPLTLFPVAWLIKLGLGPLLAGRALVVASQIATAGLLIWGGARVFTWRAGALAALLFLTSPEIFDRIHYTGIQLVALTTAACVLFFLRRQPFRSGLSFGLTLATDQHGLAICGLVAVLTVIQSRRRPRDIFRFAGGAVLVPGVVFGAVWALGGRHLWDSLVGHHLYHLSSGKAGQSSQGGNDRLWEKFSPWLYEHAYLFLGAVVAFILRGWRRKGASGDNAPAHLAKSFSVRALLLVVGAHIAIVTAMTDAIFLYVVVIAPLLALLAGIGFDAAFLWWSERRASSAAEVRRSSGLAVAGALVTLIVVLVGWSTGRADRERLDEHPYAFLPQVMHGQVAERQRLDVAARVAKQLALTPPSTVFGDPTIASAVALQSGLRVSGELADLDSRWLEAGTVQQEDVVSTIEHDHVAALVTSPWFLAQIPYFRAYIMACYQVPSTFPPPADGPGAGLFDIVVYRHNPGEGPCRVPAGEATILP